VRVALPAVRAVPRRDSLILRSAYGPGLRNRCCGNLQGPGSPARSCSSGQGRGRDFVSSTTSWPPCAGDAEGVRRLGRQRRLRTRSPSNVSRLMLDALGSTASSGSRASRGRRSGPLGGRPPYPPRVGHGVVPRSAGVRPMSNGCARGRATRCASGSRSCSRDQRARMGRGLLLRPQRPGRNGLPPPEDLPEVVAFVPAGFDGGCSSPHEATP
jgi:hypothetical protein